MQGEKKSRAQEAAEAYGLEIPPGVVLELPDWFLDKAFSRLSATFQKPYWQKIPQTTRDDIEITLRTGIENGYSIAELAKLISDAHGSAYSKQRATMVARTEVTNAVNSGHDLAIRQVAEETGFAMGREWLSVLGSTTRDTHADADGQQQPIGQPFIVGGHEARWPGDEDLPPEERINCQCTVLSSLVGEALEPGEDEDGYDENVGQPETEEAVEPETLVDELPDDEIPPPEIAPAVQQAIEQQEAEQIRDQLAEAIDEAAEQQQAADIGDSDSIPDPKELIDVEALGGSTGARLMQDRAGNKYVVKRGASPEHVREEYRAEQAYRALGVPMRGTKLFETEDGPVKVSRFIEDAIPLSDLRGEQRDNAIQLLRDHFAADAVMANWDTIGLDQDNVMLAPDGKVYRVDVGASLRFRARGDRKGDGFTKTPMELFTLRDPKRNEQNASVFGGMTNAELRESARDVLKNRTALLATLEDEPAVKAKVKERLDSLEKFVETSDKFAKEGWRDSYVNEFTEQQMRLDQADVFTDAPAKLEAGRSRVILKDENGDDFDGLRDKDSPRAKMLEMIDAQTDGKGSTLISHWASEHGGSTWCGGAAAHKHWIAENLPQPYFWKLGAADAKQEYDRLVKSYGEESLRKAWAANHAYTYGLLQQMEFPGNDKNAGVVYLARTEKTSVATRYGFDPHKTVEYGMGSCESWSLRETVNINGTHTVYCEVPHSRIFGTYLDARDPRLSPSEMFYGDDENEFAANTLGIEKWYIGAKPGGTAIEAEAYIKKRRKKPAESPAAE